MAAARGTTLVVVSLPTTKGEKENKINETREEKERVFFQNLIYARPTATVLCCRVSQRNIIQIQTESS